MIVGCPRRGGAKPPLQYDRWPAGLAGAGQGRRPVMPEPVERPGAAAWVPQTTDRDALREAATGCRGCELWQPATQVVCSAGERGAQLALIGEQPGDVEDRRGVPFVGPAGPLLDEVLDEVGIGIPRSQTYLTDQRGQTLPLHHPWQATDPPHTRSGRRPRTASAR